MSLPSRRLLTGTLLALLVALAWHAGHRRGAERGAAHERRAASPALSGERAAGEAEPAVGASGRVMLAGERDITARERDTAVRERDMVMRGERDMAVHERDMAVHQRDMAVRERDTALRERDMALATVVSLRDELERGGELSAAERAELDLYRRIGEQGRPNGLALDTIERRVGEPPTLIVTLVQFRGRERVRGRIEVTAEGEAGERDPGASSARWSTSFDLRFFATSEVSLQGIADGSSAMIEVRVVPAATALAPIVRYFRLEDIRIVD